MNKFRIAKEASDNISFLRGISIFVIVFGHVGGFWFYRPYSEFLHVFIPLFFFLSGGVTIFSYNNSKTLKEYYFKRIVSLLLPYYLVCLLSLGVYSVVHGTLPHIDFDHLNMWLQLRPSNDIMAFPLGQVWFLNTLFFITIISPVFFYLISTCSSAIYCLICFSIILSGMQMFFDVGSFFSFYGHNMFKPAIHSTFYIFGAIVYTGELYKKRTLLAVIAASNICVSFFLVRLMNLEIDYAFHIFAPDLYYVSGSFAFIAIVMLFQNTINVFVYKASLIKFALLFMYKHTFSIFLLHTFSIFLVEQISCLANPSVKSIQYGIVKLVLVLLITSMFSILFTNLSELLRKKLNSVFYT